MTYAARCRVALLGKRGKNRTPSPATSTGIVRIGVELEAESAGLLPLLLFDCASGCTETLVLLLLLLDCGSGCWTFAGEAARESPPISCNGDSSCGCGSAKTVAVVVVFVSSPLDAAINREVDSTQSFTSEKSGLSCG